MIPMIGVEVELDLLTYQVDVTSLDKAGKFAGYASLWNAVDAWKRAYMPGAFDGPLARFAAEGRYPAILWEHNKELVIGRQVLSADEKGLRVEGQLYIADTPEWLAIEDARRAYNLIKGSQYGMSFRAPFAHTDSRIDANGVLLVDRVLDVRETSITAHPAANDALIEAVASMGELVELDRRIDAWLKRLQA